MADVIPAAVQRGFSDKFYEKRKIAALQAGGTWFVNSPEESLGFILADHGFDVNWVGNVCGTHWSHGHVTLSEHDREFWDWSWQKLAENDLAAIIGCVYSKTNSKVYYVGHSQLLRDLVFFNSAISTIAPYSLVTAPNEEAEGGIDGKSTGRTNPIHKAKSSMHFLTTLVKGGIGGKSTGRTNSMNIEKTFDDVFTLIGILIGISVTGVGFSIVLLPTSSTISSNCTVGDFEVSAIWYAMIVIGFVMFVIEKYIQLQGAYKAKREIRL